MALRSNESLFEPVITFAVPYGVIALQWFHDIHLDEKQQPVCLYT